MAIFARKVEELLCRKFQGAEVEVEPGTRKGKAGGMIAWEGFDGVEHIHRQRELTQVLKEGLSPNNFDRIGIIFALTITELENHRAEYGPPSVAWDGWTEWRRLVSVVWNEVPATYGAYAIAVRVPIDRAVGRDPEGILHVGEASSLRHRIKAFDRCSSKPDIMGHMAGLRYASIKRLKEFYPSYKFCVKWLVTRSKKAAYGHEGKVLTQYLERHGELPPLNYKFNRMACE